MNDEYASIKEMEKEYGEQFRHAVLKRVSSELILEIKTHADEHSYGDVFSYHKDVWLDAYDRKVLK